MDTVLFTAFFVVCQADGSDCRGHMEVNDRLSQARRIDHFIIWGYPLLYLAGFLTAYRVFF